jgi:AraC-like DNA-binding protein
MEHPFKLSPGWRLVLRDLGVQPANVLRRAQLPEDLFARVNATVSAESYFRLWQAVADELADPDCGLRIGQLISAETFDPPIFAALCSPDLNTAAARLSRFKKLIGPLTLDVAVRSDRTVLNLGCIGALRLPVALGTTEVVFLVHFARMATRSPVQPIEVTTPEPVRNPDAYAAFLGVAITAGPSYSVSFTEQEARLPFLTANAPIWDIFESQFRQRLAEIEATAQVAERVRAALLELLPSGRSSIQDVAQTLGVSSRSLQRSLGRESTSFQKVLNTTREDLARYYLRTSALPGAEISFLLGYDDPNSFFRAFHQWTGKTPETVRAALQRGA